MCRCCVLELFQDVGDDYAKELVTLFNEDYNYALFKKRFLNFSP